MIDSMKFFKIIYYFIEKKTAQKIDFQRDHSFRTYAKIFRKTTFLKLVLRKIVRTK